MKGRKLQKESGLLIHHVPLSSQALSLFKELQNHSGNNQYMFPSRVSKFGVMSDGTINKMLKKIGYSDIQTTHGFRGLASTVLNETGMFDENLIEAQLAHVAQKTR